ncbi:hypothetical protein MTE1_4057 [Klebsiella pneumoniae JHCK1]|nr:hypothetical protein MTE1_4057 [Klebsiella pneumoniae JHCK1]
MSRYWHAEWWVANENISWYMKNFHLPETNA